MPAQSRRDIVVAFRVTSAEAAHIDAAGQALRQPRGRGDFCRASSLHYARQKVPAPTKPIRRPARRRPALDTQLLGQILAQTGKLGSNLNQLAVRANTAGALPTASTLAAIAARVTSIRTALADALGSGGDTTA